MLIGYGGVTMWVDWIAAAYAEKLVLNVPVEIYYDAKGERHVIGKSETEET